MVVANQHKFNYTDQTNEFNHIKEHMKFKRREQPELQVATQNGGSERDLYHMYTSQHKIV